MLRRLGYRPGVWEFVHVRLHNFKYDVHQLRGLSALSGDQIPSYALWSCGRGGTSLLNK